MATRRTSCPPTSSQDAAQHGELLPGLPARHRRRDLPDGARQLGSAYARDRRVPPVRESAQELFDHRPGGLRRLPGLARVPLQDGPRLLVRAVEHHRGLGQRHSRVPAAAHQHRTVLLLRRVVPVSRHLVHASRAQQPAVAVEPQRARRQSHPPREHPDAHQPIAVVHGRDCGRSTSLKGKRARQPPAIAHGVDRSLEDVAALVECLDAFADPQRPYAPPPPPDRLPALAHTGRSAVRCSAGRAAASRSRRAYCSSLRREAAAARFCSRWATGGAGDGEHDGERASSQASATCAGAASASRLRRRPAARPGRRPG